MSATEVKSEFGLERIATEVAHGGFDLGIGFLFTRRDGKPFRYAFMVPTGISPLEMTESLKKMADDLEKTYLNLP